MATVLRLGVAIRGPEPVKEAGEPHLTAHVMSPAQQPPREGSPSARWGPRVRTESRKSGSWRDTDKGLTCVAAMISDATP